MNDTITLKTGTGAEALARMEIARRLLGHAATLSTDEVATLATDYETAEANEWNPGECYRETHNLLMWYALALVERRRELHHDNLPDPVLPTVDVTNARVVHTTCTGNTVLTVDVRPASYGNRGNLRVDRIGKPLDPSSPRDVALACLAEQEIGNYTDRVAVLAFARLVLANASDELLTEIAPDGVDVPSAWETIGRMRHAAYAAGDDMLQRAWQTRHPEDEVSDAAKQAATLIKQYSSGVYEYAARHWVETSCWYSGGATTTQPEPETGQEPELADWERELLESA